MSDRATAIWRAEAVAQRLYGGSKQSPHPTASALRIPQQRWVRAGGNGCGDGCVPAAMRMCRMALEQPHGAALARMPIRPARMALGRPDDTGHTTFNGSILPPAPSNQRDDVIRTTNCKLLNGNGASVAYWLCTCQLSTVDLTKQCAGWYRCSILECFTEEYCDGRAPWLPRRF